MNEKKGGKSNWTTLLIVCGGVTALCILLLVTNFFGLRQDAMQEVAAPDQALLDAQRAQQEAAMDKTSDYPESNEYKATAAWQEFTGSYDPDGSILAAAVASGGSDWGGDYSLYPVYSQALADKLGELLERYALIPRRSMSFFYTAQELSAAAGVGAFLPEGSECVGYLYDEGSFHLDSSSGGVSYRVDRLMKGSFSDTLLSVSGEGSWLHATPDGQRLLFTLGSEQCLIHGALGNSYLTVTVLSGAVGETDTTGVTAAWLESLADSLNWSALK